MGHSNIWNAHPKTYGPGSRACRVCGNPHGLIRKYGIMCCRQCFKTNAKEIGFIKLSLRLSPVLLDYNRHHISIFFCLVVWTDIVKMRYAISYTKEEEFVRAQRW